MCRIPSPCPRDRSSPGLDRRRTTRRCRQPRARPRRMAPGPAGPPMLSPRAGRDRARTAGQCPRRAASRRRARRGHGARRPVCAGAWQRPAQGRERYEVARRFSARDALSRALRHAPAQSTVGISPWRCRIQHHAVGKRTERHRVV